MDLALTSEQESVRDLARQIFEGMCTDARLREIEAGPARFDPALWHELGRAGLLGFGIPEADGGSGDGVLEACLVLEEAGRAAAPVPLWSSVTGALGIAAHGNPDHRARLLPTFATGGAPVVFASTDGTHASTLDFVLGAQQASAILAAVPGTLLLIDPATATIEPQREPGAQPFARVTFDPATAEQLPGDPEALRDTALVLLCAFQTGVCDAAVRLTAAYATDREQFGKPIGSFQAVQQRIADAYVDVEVMRWSMWHAAWRISAGLPATEEAATAKYWASQGAGRIVAATQHLHGGMGVDMDYPLHRFTFLARQNELSLGGAREQLARLAGMLEKSEA